MKVCLLARGLGAKRRARGLGWERLGKSARESLSEADGVKACLFLCSGREPLARVKAFGSLWLGGKPGR